MRLSNILALCALGTAMAVGCGDDDDDNGGGTGGTGGTGGRSGTGAAAGTGGRTTGGTGGGAGSGPVGEGFCAPTCEAATVDEDCGEDNAFIDFSCVDGFCAATLKPCNDEEGEDQNCNLLPPESACVEVDGETSCQVLCDPGDDVDLCAAFDGECTGEDDDGEVTFCEAPEIEPSCGPGIETGDPCTLGSGQGGAGGESGASFGTCSAEGFCVCSSNSECTVEGYACQTE